MEAVLYFLMLIFMIILYILLSGKKKINPKKKIKKKTNINSLFKIYPRYRILAFLNLKWYKSILKIKLKNHLTIVMWKNHLYTNYNRRIYLIYFNK